LRALGENIGAYSMQKPIFSEIAVFLVFIQISSASFAWTGYSISYWSPGVVHELSKNEMNELNAENCLVTSYRKDYLSSQGKKSPDKHDEMILARGEFAAKGQKDLVVLCKSLDNKKEFIQVVWGGPAQCANKLLMSNVSRFVKERVPLSYGYIEHLKARTPTESTQLRAILRKEFKESKEDWDSMGLTTKQWILEDSKTPKLEHDTMWFDGRSRFAFYCHENRWIQLYDALQDGEP
jgi:hypothetical protein